MPREYPLSYYRRAEELYLQSKKEERSVYWIWKQMEKEGREITLKTIQRWASRWQKLDKFE